MRRNPPEDLFIKISVFNRGPQTADVHVLPTLWFRNTWSWRPDSPKPLIHQVIGPRDAQAVSASHAELGTFWLYIEGDASLLFTENETNNARIFGTANASPYVKDAINEYLIN